MSISEISLRINTLFRERREDVYVFLIIVLVAFLSFGLGRLSVLYGEEGGLQIIQPEGASTQAGAAALLSIHASSGSPGSTAGTGTGAYLASKSGKAYYLESCSGASRIKPENIIRFETREAAEVAGYHPAANCPGL